MLTLKERLANIDACNDYQLLWNTFVGINSSAKWIFWDEDSCRRAALSDPYSQSFRYCLDDLGRSITYSKRASSKPYGWWNKSTELEQFKHDLKQICVWQDIGNFRFYHTDYQEFVGIDIDSLDKISKLEKLRLKYWEERLGLTPGEYTIEPLRVRKCRVQRNSSVLN